MMQFLGEILPAATALVGTIAIALNTATISPKNEVAQLPPTPPPTEQQEQISPGRHTVTCALTDMNDLKVNEGDRVTEGQLLCDRTAQRQSLEARKRQIEISIEQMSLPMSQPTELPPPEFAVEESAIASLKAELELLDKAYVPPFRFRDERLKRIHDQEVYQRQAEIQERKTRVAIALNEAVAQLQKARSDYQWQQYQHGLNLIQQQTAMQRQQYQVASLAAQLQQVETQLQELTAVRTPYAGRVRRVKFLGQQDRTIRVEVTINVKSD